MIQFLQCDKLTPNKSVSSVHQSSNIVPAMEGQEGSADREQLHPEGNPRADQATHGCGGQKGGHKICYSPNVNLDYCYCSIYDVSWTYLSL